MDEVLPFLVMGALGLGITLLLGIVLMLILAALGWHFTRIEEGKTVFISRGDDLKAIWPNIERHRMSKEVDFGGLQWLIKDDKKKECDEAFFHGALWGTVWLQKFLWHRLSIRFVSILWPHTRVNQFKVSRKRLKEGADVETDKSLKDRVIASPDKDKPVNSLLFLVPRPIYLEGIELAGDNSKINLLILVVFQQVIPALPVYYLEGDFFPLLDAAIEAAVIDFFATQRVAVNAEGEFIEDEFDEKKVGEDPENYKKGFLTYAHWLKLKKAGGSPMEKHLRHINISREYYEELNEGKKEGEENELAKHLKELKVIPPPRDDSTSSTSTISMKLEEAVGEGIIPRFGFALKSFRLVDWVPHKSTEDLAKALLAKETEKHTADGVREKAKGERIAFKLRGSGESQRYERLVKALTEQGVDPNLAAEVVKTQVRTENIRDGKVVTYVEGGASANVLVSTQLTPPPPTNP